MPSQLARTAVHRINESVLAVFLIAFLVLALPACALDPQKQITQYVHLVWRHDSGLPEDFAGPLVQTKDGYIWLGTSAGLVRFDGVRFKLFRLRDEAGIHSNAVFALAAGHDGGLWIGTSDGLLQYKSGGFKSYSTEYPPAPGAIFSLAEDQVGNLWVGTPRGLGRLKDNAWQLFTTKDGLPLDDVRRISVGPTGDVWLGSAAGVTRYRDEKFVTYTERDGLPTNHVRAILQDRSGQVWVGTALGMCRLEKGHFVSVPGLKIVSAIYEDHDRNLWIGTSSGLVRYANGKFSTYSGSQQVVSIIEDRERGLWAGTEGRGLHRFYIGLLANYSTLDGLADDETWSATQDRDGDFWIGTDKGLSRYHNGHFHNYSTKDGLKAGRVLSTYVDNQGDIWIGTDAGLSVFRNGRLFTYGPRQGISNDYVLAIYQDRSGDLWVTAENRLYRLHGDTVVRSYGVADGLSHSGLRTIAEDTQGNLWLGSNGDGVFRLSHGTFTHYTTASGLPSNIVLSIYADKDGAVWIGTDGGGIARYKNDLFTIYNTRTGLYDDTVNSIVEDDLGRLWVGSNAGIYRVEKMELNEIAAGKRTSVKSVSYGTQDGMRSPVTSGGVQPAVWKARDGTLWFPTTGGVVLVDPHNVQKNVFTPEVMIEEVSANKRLLTPQSSLRVPPGEGQLEFHYTAFHYNSPQKIRFRYKLEGFDKDWIEAGERRTAYYTNIPPGRYAFRVTAANVDGVWNDAGAGLQLYLEPHFYQSYWFYAICVLGMAFAGTSAYRLRIRQVRARETELQELVNQSTRELRERKRVEAELRRSEDKFAKIFHSSPVSMAISTVDTGLMLDVNQSFLKLFGFEFNEVIGHTAVDLGIWKDASEREPMVAVVRGHRTLRNLEANLRKKDGKVFNALVSAEILNFGGEECLLAIALDITEQRHLEQQLRQAQKMEAIGTLSGGIAHDFNNLLTVIKGYSGLVLETEPDQALRDHVRRIDDAAERAASLTSQLLAFSRRQVLQPKILDLNSLVLRMDNMLRRLIGEDLEVVTVAAPDLGPVKADPGQIEQVIMNLVVNARDAMPEGGKLTLETENVEIDENYAREHVGVSLGRYAMLAVSDTGVGMDAETKARIFEPFYTTKDPGRGTGLGLAMVYGIVKQSGGNISVYSEPGHGTTFKIYLPRVDAKGEAIATEQRSVRSNRGTEVVLLVEDDRDVRELARTVLTAYGYSVLEADNASAVKSLCEQYTGRIDLLLTDVVMPGTGGRELAEQVIARRPGIRVLYMSGYTTNAIVHQGELDPDTFFLPKPFTPDSLTRKVREVLDHPGLKRAG